jgi:hypothetical protein
MCYISPQSVEIRPVDSRKSSLEEYIYLPSRLYKLEPRWVPPFYSDEWAFHHPQKNKALTYCETIRLMAWHESVPVGRIMGIIHHPYNEAHACKTARFFHFDCINNPEIAHALLTAIEKWARDKGMSKIIGPFGFSDKDPQGLQIEGFEYLPVLAAPANPPYLPALVEHEGYLKEVDCVSYRMDVPRQVPPLYQKITERLSASNRFKLIEFTSKRQLKPYILPVLRLMNKAYANLFGFTPLDEEEMKKFATQYLPVLDPEFVKAVVTKNEELIAFAIAMPDMSLGIQKAKGKLFPLGFIHIIRAMRNTKQLNLMLGAIKPEFHGLGFSAWMGQALLNSAHKRGLTVMDSHLILENNYPMRSECEKINGTVYKRFRIFSKLL